MVCNIDKKWEGAGTSKCIMVCNIDKKVIGVYNIDIDIDPKTTTSKRLIFFLLHLKTVVPAGKNGLAFKRNNVGLF